MRETGYDVAKVDQIDADVTALAAEYDENAQREVDEAKNAINAYKLRIELYRKVNRMIRILDKNNKKSNDNPLAIEAKKPTVVYGPYGPYVVHIEANDQDEDDYFYEQ
jgi:coenzyme F420-reducing hydrogenase alpha subunit